MKRSRTILAALGFSVLAAVGVAAPPRAGDKAPDAAPTLHDLKGVHRLVYAPDGKSLLIQYNVPPNLNGASMVGVWDVESGKFRAGMEKVPEHCEQIAFSPDGTKAAGISAGQKKLTVWDANTGKAVQEFQLPEWQQFMPNAPFLAFTPDGGALTSVYKNKVLRAKLGGEVKLEPDAPEIWAPETVAFAPATDVLVFASNPKPGNKTGGKFLVYDLSKAGDPQTVPYDGWVRAISLTPDGKTMAVVYEWTVGDKGNVPGKVELWDAQAWKAQSTLPSDKRKDFLTYARVTIAPDGKTLAGVPTFNLNKGQTALELFDTDGNILRGITQSKAFTDLAFSPDGKTAVVIHGNNPLQFIDTATGKDKEP